MGTAGLVLFTDCKAESSATAAGPQTEETANKLLELEAKIQQGKLMIAELEAEKAEVSSVGSLGLNQLAMDVMEVEEEEDKEVEEGEEEETQAKNDHQQMEEEGGNKVGSVAPDEYDAILKA